VVIFGGVALLLAAAGPYGTLPLFGSRLILWAMAAVTTFAAVRVATRVDPLVAIRTE
jgi:hypothetical protein